MSDAEQTAEKVFRSVDRDVWVVTAASGSSRSGLVATWVMQTSLDPAKPTLMAGLAPNHYTAELARASGRFVVHLLRPDQASTALRFALVSGRQQDKFSQLDVTPSPAGVPRLTDCAGWLECATLTIFDVGDRWIFVAEVTASGAPADSSSAILRESQLIAAATHQQRQQLKADRDSDIARQRPLAAAWRAKVRSLPVAW